MMLLAAGLMFVSGPALAHKGEKHGAKAAPNIAKVPQASVAYPGGGRGASPASLPDAGENAPPTGFFARLLDWLGRLHPVVVHFPMAFLPAALFTAVVGRKRPSFAAPVQFLVVAGGSLSALSALLGWINAGFVMGTDDGLLAAHRWLGSFMGIGALGLAIWAARRPERDRSPAMIVGLAIITAAVVTQGWLGGALVHGADHLDF